LLVGTLFDGCLLLSFCELYMAFKKENINKKHDNYTSMPITMDITLNTFILVPMHHQSQCLSYLDQSKERCLQKCNKKKLELKIC
jgi:hypothetical protein